MGPNDRRPASWPRRSVLGAAASIGLLPFAARAETYPARTVRLLVGFAPGSTTDLLARQIGDKIGTKIGQRLIIENRTGAGGSLASIVVARAEPDGYTILFGTGQTQAVNVSIYPDLAYHPTTDFSPIARVASQPLVFAVHPSLGVKAVAEFVAYAKAHPGTVSFASTGVGSSPHLAGATLARTAGLTITHIPYNSSQLIPDLLKGRVSCMLYPYPPLHPYLDTGQLVALATTGPDRSPWLPNLPTMIEAGFAGFSFAPWYALYGPAHMQAEAVTTLADAIKAVLEDERTKALFFEAGTIVSYAGPQDLATFTAAEIERFRPIVDAAGAKGA
jgi:tripartite-type tricarboxylate transporter receptor subunit TctC